MADAVGLSTDIANMIVKNGNRCSFHYFSTTALSGNDYDNEILTGSITNWGYCFVQPLNRASASIATLVEQGQITYQDQTAYIVGSVTLQANMKIGLGSPNTNTYKILPDGIIPYILGSGSNPVYYKCFIRDLNLGSFL